MAKDNNKRNRHNDDGAMTVEEAGRKGGEATARNHDREFYEEIGRKGGEATAENHDREFYEKIGKKGGEATAKNHDKEFYEEIGHKGGEARSRQDGDHDDNRERKMSKSEAGRKGGKHSHDNDDR